MITCFEISSLHANRREALTARLLAPIKDTIIVVVAVRMNLFLGIVRSCRHNNLIAVNSLSAHCNKYILQEVSPIFTMGFKQCHKTIVAV